MSLDVYLEVDHPVSQTKTSGIFIRENGKTIEITEREWNKRYPDREPVRVASDETETNEVFSANITHNLGVMAKEADLYMALWRPDELDITIAKDLIDLLEKGLSYLRTHPYSLKKLNPDNGWGTYDGLVEFVSQYLEACKKYPDAKVRVWR